MANITWTFNQPTEKIILTDDYALFDENNNLIIDIRNTGVNYIVVPNLYMVSDKDDQYPSNFQRLHYTEASASTAGNTLANTYYGGNWASQATVYIELVNGDGKVTGLTSIMYDNLNEIDVTNSSNTPLDVYNNSTGQSVFHMLEEKVGLNYEVTVPVITGKFDEGGGYTTDFSPIVADMDVSSSAFNYFNTYFNTLKVPETTFLNTLINSYNLSQYGVLYSEIDSLISNNSQAYLKIGLYHFLSKPGGENNVWIEQINSLPQAVQTATYTYNGSSDVMIANQSDSSSRVKTVIGNSRSDGNATKNVITIL